MRLGVRLQPAPWEPGAVDGGRYPSPIAASEDRRIQNIDRFVVETFEDRARKGKASGGTGRGGQSTRKWGCPLPVPRGTSLVSTAWKWTLLSERNGTATTLLRFCLLDCSRACRERTPGITRRSRRCQRAGNRSIRSISAQ